MCIKEAIFWNYNHPVYECIKGCLDQSTKNNKRLPCPLGTTNEDQTKAAAPGMERKRRKFVKLKSLKIGNQFMYIRKRRDLWIQSAFLLGISTWTAKHFGILKYLKIARIKCSNSKLVFLFKKTIVFIPRYIVMISDSEVYSELSAWVTSWLWSTEKIRLVPDSLFA